MIPKTRRYPLRSDRSIFSQGQHVRGRLLDLFLLPSSSPRLAVVVGKNVSLKASERNTIRRRIQKILIDMPPQNKFDVVVRAFRSASKATYDQLKDEISKLIPNT